MVDAIESEGVAGRVGWLEYLVLSWNANLATGSAVAEEQGHCFRNTNDLWGRGGINLAGGKSQDSREKGDRNHFDNSEDRTFYNRTFVE